MGILRRVISRGKKQETEISRRYKIGLIQSFCDRRARTVEAYAASREKAIRNYATSQERALQNYARELARICSDPSLIELAKARWEFGVGFRDEVPAGVYMGRRLPLIYSLRR